MGLLDEKLARTIQLDADLFLETAVMKARQAEAILKQQKVVRVESGITENTLEVDAVRKKAEKSKTTNEFCDFKKSMESLRVSGNKACGRCGKYPQHVSVECPAITSKCRKCEKKGYWSKFCKTKTIATVAKESDDEEEEFFLGKNKSYSLGLYQDTIIYMEHAHSKIVKNKA